MTRVLMRGYAPPFEPLDPLTAIMDRRIGRNSGNLIFTASVLRGIMQPDVEVDIESSASLAHRASEISEKYDHVILPFANAFRRGFVEYLDKYTDLIEQLRIPVTITGIGAQASLDYDWTGLGPIEANVKRFISAVLDRGPSIGVRGDMTRRYLNSLGFDDVETIGCPSMYMYGRELNLVVPETLRPDSRIAINLTPRVPMPEKFNTTHLQKFPETTYIAQDQADLEMMLGGAPVAGDSDYPGSFAHPFLSQDRTVMYLNAQQWIGDMSKYDFAFGSRIHGNVAAILAGTPGHVIAHDSRTRELAEYFEIPHTLSSDLNDSHSAVSLFEASDWNRLAEGHGARFDRYVKFLDSHGVRHSYSGPEAGAEFDRRTAAGGVGDESRVSVRSPEPSHLVARQWIATTAYQKKIAGLERSVRSLRKANKELGAQLDEVRERSIDSSQDERRRGVRFFFDRRS